MVLGVAQDGGIPQAGDKDHPGWHDPTFHRRVVSLAVVDGRGDGEARRWLFEATPDLPSQLHTLDELAPVSGKPGLAGIFLTHAHAGHYTGLLFLGFEIIGAAQTPVYALPRMAAYLRQNGPWEQLVRYQNVDLRELAAGESVALADDLAVTPFLVPHREEYSEVGGFRIDGPRRSVLFIPDINGWEEWDEWGIHIEDRIREVDVAYLDGSFWDQGEVPGRDMSTFPHPLMRRSMERFAALPATERQKIRFLHLNHTNPVVDAQGKERSELRGAGMSLAEELERIDL